MINHHNTFLPLRALVFLTVLLLPTLVSSQVSTEIDGRAFVCSESSTIYEVNFTPGHTYSWSLSGGGSIVGATDTSVVEIFWTAFENAGPFILTLTETDLMSTMTTITLEIRTEEIIGLACNSDVQVSLDFTCALFVTADMILEDIRYDNDSYEVTLKDPITKQIIPQGISGEYYLNRPIEVSVEHLCSSNSCWGMLIFEDKNLPALICEVDTVDCNQSLLPDSLGFPLPPEATVVRIEDQIRSYSIESFDPCSDITLSYADETVSFGCSDPLYSGMLLRRWTATDGENGLVSCTDTIYARRASIADLIMPTDVNISLIECDGDFEVLENGAPSPDFSGAPSGPACSNIYLEFDDVIVPLCGASFKVIREWTITDACVDEFIIYRQLIKVSDAQAPIVECPEPQTFSSDKYSCGAGVDIPLPLIEDCSGLNFEIFYKKYVFDDDPLAGPYKTDFTLNDDNTFNLPDLYEGLNWVIINVIDECGNETQCAFQVEIIDDVEPTSICDLHTVVALDEKGIAKVKAETFDDESWDNCSAIDFDVMRVSGPCSDGLWRDSIAFCCDDLDSIHMVFMRVTDESGNSSSCMVEVEVQDKVAPEVICPQDMTLDCSVDIWDLTPFGIAALSDNCGARLVEDTTHMLNKCWFGTIERTFTGIDSAGNQSSCVQVLTFDNIDNPFDETDIFWPTDYVTTGCEEDDFSPEALPPGFNYPGYNDDECAKISFTYSDKLFADFDTACFVIIRSWVLIDACQWEHPEHPGEYGKWKYNQRISIYNDIAPTFDDGCADLTISGQAQENCTFFIDFVKGATDDCSTKLEYEFEVDLFMNDTIDWQKDDNDASGTFPIGTHEIKWYVFDQCANANACHQKVTVVDGKAPTPYCINGITTVLMHDIGAVEVWASDLDLNSEDNCTAQEDLIFAFSEDMTDTNRSYVCSQLTEGELMDTVEIYVFDEEGNSDFCTTTLSIRDNSNCDGDPIGIIAGRVNTSDFEMVNEVTVNVSDNEFSYNQMSDSDGFFQFTALPTASSYNIELSKDDEPKNGVSTLDLVLIQKHILGSQKLNDPYKIIAADINNSGSISATDLITLRKLILGIYKDFPSNKSWRFIPNGYEFLDPSKPFPFAEEKQIDNLMGPMLDNDFMAVKIGDVNGSVSLNNQANVQKREKAVFKVEEISLVEGLDYILPVNIDNQGRSIAGMQFEVKYDKTSIANLQFYNGDEVIDPGSYYKNEDRIRFCLTNDDSKLQLKMSFQVTKAVNSSDAFVSSLEFENEIYFDNADGNIETRTIEWEFDSSNEDKTVSLNSQNIPNPFSDFTTISFDLPQDDVVDFKVYDLAGNLITHINKAYKSGANEIQFYNDDRISGILIYTLITTTLFESKKMIVIN